MDFLNRPTQYGSGGGSVPEFVTIDDVPAPSGSSVSLGVGPGGPVTIDLDSESPHILVNAPTNKGKSAVARSVAVQRLALGDLVVVLDRKMHSHRWARGLAPLVHYADDVASIGSALINLGHELRRRNEIVRDFAGPESDAPIGPRIVVIFEETNATLSQLKVADKAMGGGYGAMDAFSDLMFMGRAVQMHVIGFAQLASYRSGLTADLIENFGTRVMIGYSPQAWRWLASDCGKYRVAPSEVGRGIVCHDGRATETQLVWMPKESAQEYVTAAVPAQRRARELSGTRRNLPGVWRTAIGR